MSFADQKTETLLTIRANLRAGLDKVIGHFDAGTFKAVGEKGKAPPAESGQITVALLDQVDAELDRREQPMARKVVVVDIDGTVALMGKGEPGRRGPYDWHRVSEDDPNQPIIDLVDLFRAAGHRIIFVSGRNEVCRADTRRWLLGHGAAFPGEALHMRPESENNRPDDEIKLEIYKREIEPRYQVAFVVDDRDRVVAMWRSLGLTVLQVAPGSF